MEKRQYECSKCGHTHYEKDELRATGGMFSKMFDIQNKRFFTVTCTRCGYTELYKRTNSTGENIIDWFIGN